jgi:hypothetical protein
MGKLNTTIIALMMTLMCCIQMAAADPIASSRDELLLTPPQEVRPIVVQAYFELHDLNEINNEEETFDFSGVLTLRWHDPRLAFDPVVEGLEERIFQGDYQFKELYAGWYPQVVLVNKSEMYQKGGTVLRIQPDGTSTLTETLNATAKGEFEMKRYPFDRQSLEAVFGVLGFNQDEVLFQIAESDAAISLGTKVQLPQWKIIGANASVLNRSTAQAGRHTISSAFAVNIDAQRKPYYMVRLVILPLTLIVLLSSSVFWMNRSSIGERLSVSFIGILTSVAYQSVVSIGMPQVAYITWMHGFVLISLFTMGMSVVVNLVVNRLDQRGKIGLGDRVDRWCRWGFPLAYFVIILVFSGIVTLL